MSSFYLFALIFAFVVNVARAEQCSQAIPKNSSELFVDDWIGFKCDPLDEFAMKENGFKSPCDCLKKEMVSTRIKDAMLEKIRNKRLNRIQNLLEIKVAEVIRTQIDYGFEQSLRLDTILKQGGMDINHQAIKEAFPENCRASKIGETIAEASNLSDKFCNKNTYNKRLKVFLEGKKDFNEYLNSKMSIFESAAMNIVPEEDKKRGLCVPYKSYQSLSNANPFRKSYLTLAKYFSSQISCQPSASIQECDKFKREGAFKKFQGWASDRSNPKDVYTYIGIYERSKKVLPQRQPSQNNTTSGGGFGRIGSGLLFNQARSGMGEIINQELSNEATSEEIDRDAILNLLKTDPIFERMIKDPDFFTEVTRGKYGAPDSIKESPEVISALMESQDRQCKKLYGAEKIASLNDGGGSTLGSSKKQQNHTAGAATDNRQNENNLLTQFLCDEDFPKKFLNKDTIRNILAPEFKKEAGGGTKHMEAIIAKWAYCSDDDVKESADGSFEIVFRLDSATKILPPIPLSDFLNLSLNPKSDLDSSVDNKDNKYEKFNETLCGFVDEQCKNINIKSKKTTVCSTSNIAKTATQKMLTFSLGAVDALAIQAKVDDQDLTDKAVRFSLNATGKLSSDQVNTLILLRSQTVEAKNARVEEDLKSVLGISKDTDIDTYLSENGGREEVLKKSIIPYDIKRRMKDRLSGFVSDNVYVEKTTNNNSSYFSNYYALAEAADEKFVSSYNKDPVKQDGRVVEGSVIVGTGSVGEIKDPTKEGPLGQVVAPMYQRKNFASVSSDPIKPIAKPEIPENKDKTSEDKKEQVAKAPEVDKDEILENNLKEERTEVVSNPSRGIKNFSNLILSKNSNSSDSRMGKENLDKSRERNKERDELEKIKKDLEDKLDRKRTQLENLENNSDSNSGGNGLSEHNEQKNKLMDEIRKLKEDNRANRSNRGIANNNNNFNNRSPDIGDGNDDFGGDSFNKPFNNGYNRGEEFDKERMKDKLDDGSSEFDPEQGSKKDKVSDDKSQRGGSGGSEGAGGGKGGSPALSKSGGGGDDFEGEGSGGANGKRKRRRGGSGSADDVVTKCGTGPILKCIFPNSYFVDEKIKDRLYTTIHNLKLEGRMFQGLHKARKSKKDMRMGDSNNVKYYLYTYDLVTTEPIFDRQPAGGPKGQNKNVRQITNDERDVIFKEIKENRGNPLFKKKLFKYERMTQAVPPRRLLNEKEASEAVKRSITQEEYEALQE